MRIIENRNRSVVNRVRQQIKENGGYCLCSNEKNEFTKCMCEKFTNLQHWDFVTVDCMKK